MVRRDQQQNRAGLARQTLEWKKRNRRGAAMTRKEDTGFVCNRPQVASANAKVDEEKKTQRRQRQRDIVPDKNMKRRKKQKAGEGGI